MARIVVPEDCGNAPKKAQIRDFNVAFANRDVDALLEAVTADIRWKRVGFDVVEGKGAFETELRQMQGAEVTELVVDEILTHGNVGAANGIIRFADGRAYAFCDVYRFSSHSKNAKIKSVTSYVIEVDE